MAKVICFFAVLIALQSCLDAAKLKQQQQQVEKSTVEELATKTKAFINEISKKIEKELPDSKQVVETLHTQTQVAADAVQNIITKLKEEVKAHEGQVNSVTQQVQLKLNEAATALQNAAGPDVTAKAKDLRVTLDNNLKKTVNEIEKLVQKVQPDVKNASDNIYKWAQDSLNDLIKVGKDLQTQVDSKIVEHQKTHKH